jgi:hypothetical protein
MFSWFSCSWFFKVMKEGASDQSGDEKPLIVTPIGTAYFSS